jgi:dTMP kinase
MVDFEWRPRGFGIDHLMSAAMAGRGRLITIEGVDGAGKTTLAAALVDALPARGVKRVEALREPGGVALAERVRALVVDPALRCGPRAEALLYAAARAQLVEERLNPLLETGAWVVLDRFVDSSLAYQGAGRGLGVVEVAELNAFATGGLEADRTLLLRVGAAQGRARQTGRGGEPDRLEREDAGFFAVVAAGYDALAAAQPRRVRVVDASGSQAAVLTAALEALGDLLEGG